MHLTHTNAAADFSASCTPGEGAMSSTSQEILNLQTEEERSFLTELLEAENARLLVGIRHTFHREYRDELHRRLDLLERLLKRVGNAV